MRMLSAPHKFVLFSRPVLQVRSVLRGSSTSRGMLGPKRTTPLSFYTSGISCYEMRAYAATRCGTQLGVCGTRRGTDIGSVLLLGALNMLRQ
eukprot:880314-Rhodomonas_salina.1